MPTPDDDSPRFNQWLDAALAGEAAWSPTENDGEAHDLQRVAAQLAAASFADEARPAPALRARLRAARAAHPTVAPRGRRWALAMLAAALALLAAFWWAGPEQVRAALTRWLGYVPGVGLVAEPGALRALAAPVSQTREGITVTVQQVVAGVEETVVLVQVDGLSLAAANSQGEGALTGSTPQLRLPNGRALTPIGGDGGGWGSGFRWRLVFGPVPAAEEALTLDIPVLPTMPRGVAPESWALALALVPAPADLEVLPVVELPAPTATAPAGTAAATAASHAALPPLDLRVERLVALDEGFLLYSALTWDERLPALGGASPRELRLTDAAGAEIPLEYADHPDEGAAHRTAWSVRTAGVYGPGPLTLWLEAARLRLPEAASFTFDPGPAPAIGQTWSVDQSVVVLGQAVHVRSARAVQLGDLLGYEFELAVGPELRAVELALADAGSGSSGGGSYLRGAGVIISTALADDPLGGPTRVRVDAVTVSGPWTAQVAVPAGSQPAVTATPAQAACLTSERWEALLAAGPAPLPAGVGGRAAAYGPLLGPNDWVVYMANLDGGDARVVGPGTWPALSPDGATVAYAGEDGLYLAPAQGGAGTRLGGTVANDYHPVWSPDSRQLAFVRVADTNLYVLNADGTGLRAVTTGVEYEDLVGWSPDGASLYYTVLAPENLQQLRRLDLATGAVTELFGLAYRGRPALSPDGTRLAFTDTLFGETGGGLFVSQVDGTGRRLLAQLGTAWGVTDVVWAPEGDWLLLGLLNLEALSAQPSAALLHPATCEAVALPGLVGHVGGWGP